MGLEKAVQWLGNAQSYYVVRGYIYLKVKSCKKIANENVMLRVTDPRGAGFPVFFMQLEWGK